MMPKKFTTWLYFEYKGVEVKVELLEFIYNNDKICDKLYENKSYQVQEYING